MKKGEPISIKGYINLRVRGDEAIIEIYDDASRINFVQVRLTPEQFCHALGGMSHIPCEQTIVNSPNLIGKKQEVKTQEFEVENDNIYRFSKDYEYLTSLSQARLDSEGEGWISDGYFGSSDSIFTKDGKTYCRVTVRRWV